MSGRRHEALMVDDEAASRIFIGGWSGWDIRVVKLRRFKFSNDSVTVIFSI